MNEAFLEFQADEGEAGVAEVVQLDVFFRRAEQFFGAGAGFGAALAAGAEYDPMDLQFGPLRQQRQQRAAGADFQIVAMRAQAQNRVQIVEVDSQHVSVGVSW